MLSTLEMAFIQYWERYISSVIIIIINQSLSHYRANILHQKEAI